MSTGAPFFMPRHCFLVYGAPTTGKSTAVKTLRSAGIACADSDEIITNLMSMDEWHTIRFRPGANAQALESLIMREMNIQHPKAEVMFTNFPSFTAFNHIRFYRTAEVMRKEMLARAGTDDERAKVTALLPRVDGWCATAEREVESYNRFSMQQKGRPMAFLLREGEYLLADLLIEQARWFAENVQRSRF